MWVIIIASYGYATSWLYGFISEGLNDITCEIEGIGVNDL